MNNNEHTIITTTTTTPTSNYDLVIAKCSALTSMLLLTLLAGSVPHLLNYRFQWTRKEESAHSSKVVQCLLHFGGGVLLATIFMHLLPEVQEIVQHLQQHQNLRVFSFPLPEALMCLGFILMYLIDEALHAFLRCRQIRNDQQQQQQQPQQTNAFMQTSPQNGSVSSISTEKTYDGEEKFYNNQKSNGSLQHQHNDCELPVATTEFTATTVSCQDSCHARPGHSHLPRACDTGKGISSSFRGLFIVLALSLHEIFEGLAIGLEDEVKSVWFLFAAVCAHKLVLAFCVGVELLVARTRLTLTIIYSVTFAVVSPIGIAIGMLVTHNSTFGVDSPLSVILQGLACGTLMYVVFFEILSKHRSGLLAFASTLIGFCVMFGMQQLGHDHDHGHDDYSHEHYAKHAHKH